MVAQAQDETTFIDKAKDLETELGLRPGSLRDAVNRGSIKGVKRPVSGIPGKGTMWFVDRAEVVEALNNGRFAPLPSNRGKKINYPKSRKSPRTVDADIPGPEGDDDPMFELLDSLEAIVRELRRSIKTHDRVIRKETIHSVAESLIESSRPR